MQHGTRHSCLVPRCRRLFLPQDRHELACLRIGLLWLEEGGHVGGVSLKGHTAGGQDAGCDDTDCH
jgi:hypothetical protein